MVKEEISKEILKYFELMKTQLIKIFKMQQKQCIEENL